MRPSFRDLARTAEVRDVVTCSVCGDATEQMQRLYSTVSDREQAEERHSAASQRRGRRAKGQSSKPGSPRVSFPTNWLS
jgi:hypothetical protein